MGCSGASVPGWASKRRKTTLVRFQGEYSTPEALHARCALEASQERSSRGGPQAVNRSLRGTLTAGVGKPLPINPVDSYAPTLTAVAPAEWVIDKTTGERVGISRVEGRAHVSRPVEGIPLPCRSLETTQSNGPGKDTPGALVGPRKKVALALSWNVANMCKEWGVERIGFLTLTFADHVTDAREAQRRFNSLATNILRKRYPAHIAVLERQKTGRIHYHLLVVLPDDIRTGCDFDRIALRDYKSANKALRLEWAYWRKTAPVFGFGRTELLPIKSDADALGQYVGKYIAKGQAFRTEDDKGVRLVRYSGGARTATCKFAELKNYPNEWRAKVCTFVRQMAEMYPHRRIRDMDDIAFHFGKRWAYQWRDYILALPPSDLSVPF